MESFYNGPEIREEILLALRKKIVEEKREVQLAVLLVGNDPVCESYVNLKKKFAEKLGISFCLYKFDENNTEEEIIDCIKFLNADEEINGIMIQIPVDKKFDRDKLISTISPKKDIDGLRFCLGLDSEFRPPVVLAILDAINHSRKDIQKSKILIVGKGFLVGDPLARVLREMKVEADVADSTTKNIKELSKKADILISAVGKAYVINFDMTKPGAVLIDAGTTEQGGSLVGDIDPLAFKESEYYTPVPGGIGPVTLAMLFKNLVG